VPGAPSLRNRTVARVDRARFLFCHDEPVDLAALDFLLSPAGAQLLTVVDAAYDRSNALQVSAGLRPKYAPEHVAAALSQVALRRQAVVKFGADARAMFFTRDGLEQATHPAVARHRAARAGESGLGSVFELACGVGADLVAFGRAGLEVTAVDRDPLTAGIAAANLRVLGLGGRVAVGAAESQDHSAADLVYVDPARRSARGRVFAPDAYSPPWSFVESLFGRDAVVKTAPGIAHAAIPPGVEAEWVSLDGQLREAALWSGRTVSARRRATVLRTGHPQRSLTEADDPGAVEIRPPGRYVYEPDDAVVRAHLVTSVASDVHGWLLDSHVAYVSSDVLASGPLARGFEVLDVLPFREKSLRAALRARNVGSLTIKKRGVLVTPEELRRRLRLTGTETATIIVTRAPTGAVVLLVRPLAGA
jgi:SAM-dependent methyltransferase